MKTKLRELAIMGGPPAFNNPLFIGVPNIGNRQRLHDCLDDILQRRWLTNDGCYVQELERRMAAHLDVPHCIAMCNATLALQIGIRALGLHGEVLVPSFTFIATAHALTWEGIKPVFCDIDPHTHNIDPRCVERSITPATTGILGVHLWGRPCDVSALTDIAKAHRLKLLFDSAHALGNTCSGQPIGSFGDFEVFSLHATKIVNSFEGGILTTRDSELADRVRKMRNFGFAGYDNVVQIGTNAKMCEMSAAMGLTSLDSFDAFIAANRNNYETYRTELASLPGLKVIDYDKREKNNYQYVIVEIDENQSSLTRDQLLRVLWTENVLARRYFYPGCHRMEPYRTMNPEAARELPVTTKLSNRILALPTGSATSTDMIQKVSQCIRFALAHGKILSPVLDEIAYSKSA